MIVLLALITGFINNIANVLAVDCHGYIYPACVFAADGQNGPYFTVEGGGQILRGDTFLNCYMPDANVRYCEARANLGT